MGKRDYRGRFKKRRYLSHTEARAMFDRMYEAKEREAEAHLRTPEGEAERQEFNRRQLERLRRNPSRMKPRAAPIAATKTAADVARYLRSIKGKGAPTGVIPITLSVRGRTWQGARYVQSGSVRLYMIGDLPPAWRERKKTVFNIGRDLRDWYVAAHMSEPIAAQYAEFHPMGANFILIPWEVPGGESIDKYEAKPYTRVKAQIKRVK